MPKKTTPNVGISEIKEFQGKLGNKDSHYNKLIGLYQQLLTQKTVGNLNEGAVLDN